MFQLKNVEPKALTQYLRRRNWLPQNESVRDLTIPGAGNMNYVIRVTTDQGHTIILKQSSAFVEKYPQVAAPVNRVAVEGQFYRIVSGHPAMKSRMPAMLGMDKTNHILALEDLGEASDYTFLYELNQSLTDGEIQELVASLNVLHGHFRLDSGVSSITNQKMRRLNHEHIFHYPFLEENGFNLDVVQPGLQAMAMPFKKDMALKKAVAQLGKIYLSSGDTLLHGDFYPGSWLKTASGIQVIDPEFGFHGRPEFDLSVMMAHLHMTRHDERSIAAVLTHYEFSKTLDINLLNKFVGVEIMRRLIGLAQLPLKATPSFRQDLLDLSYQLILK